LEIPAWIAEEKGFVRSSRRDHPPARDAAQTEANYDESIFKTVVLEYLTERMATELLAVDGSEGLTKTYNSGRYEAMVELFERFFPKEAKNGPPPPCPVAIVDDDDIPF
jgi:hypothetical protein